MNSRLCPRWTKRRRTCSCFAVPPSVGTHRAKPFCTASSTTSSYVPGHTAHTDFPPSPGTCRCCKPLIPSIALSHTRSLSRHILPNLSDWLVANFLHKFFHKTQCEAPQNEFRYLLLRLHLTRSLTACAAAAWRCTARQPGDRLMQMHSLRFHVCYSASDTYSPPGLN